MDLGQTLQPLRDPPSCYPLEGALWRGQGRICQGPRDGGCPLVAHGGACLPRVLPAQSLLQPVWPWATVCLGHREMARVSGLLGAGAVARLSTPASLARRASSPLLTWTVVAQCVLGFPEEQ